MPAVGYVCGRSLRLQRPVNVSGESKRSNGFKHFLQEIKPVLRDYITRELKLSPPKKITFEHLKQLLLRSGQNIHARAAGWALLDGKLRLENLFEQFALVHGGWRTDAKALAALEQDDLIGVLRGEI